MRKVLMAFAGLILIVLMFGMVYVGTAIYDTSSQQTIDVFFFQRADMADQRIPNPKPVEDLNGEDIRYMLIDKFIMEYFYVIPDINNATARVEGKSIVAEPLYTMMSKDAFLQWRTTVGTEISKLAAQKVMRLARVINIEPEEGVENWWRITYKLTTWNWPNDLSRAPDISYGTMNIKLLYEPGIRPKLLLQPFDLGGFLEAGRDPSLIFKFYVEQVEMEK